MLGRIAGFVHGFWGVASFGLRFMTGQECPGFAQPGSPYQVGERGSPRGGGLATLQRNLSSQINLKLQLPRGSCSECSCAPMQIFSREQKESYKSRKGASPDDALAVVRRFHMHSCTMQSFDANELEQTRSSNKKDEALMEVSHPSQARSFKA